MRFTVEFFKASIIRAIRTAAQTALTMITLGGMFSDMDWLKIASVSGVAAVYSLISSLATGLPEAKNAGSDGTLVIDTSSETDDIFRIELDKPLSEIQDGDTYILHVKED